MEATKSRVRRNIVYIRVYIVYSTRNTSTISYESKSRKQEVEIRIRRILYIPSNKTSKYELYPKQINIYIKKKSVTAGADVTPLPRYKPVFFIANKVGLIHIKKTYKLHPLHLWQTRFLCNNEKILVYTFTEYKEEEKVRTYINSTKTL